MIDPELDLCCGGWGNCREWMTTELYDEILARDYYRSLDRYMCAIELYTQYRIERLAGLTNKTVDEWIKEKVGE